MLKNTGLSGGISHDTNIIFIFLRIYMYVSSHVPTFVDDALPCREISITYFVRPFPRKILDTPLIDWCKYFLTSFLFIGEHKTKKDYGSALLTLSPPLYGLIKRYIDLLEKSCTNVDGDTHLFCQKNGAPLQQVGGSISIASKKVFTVKPLLCHHHSLS